MAKEHLTTNSSLEASIREAERFGASADEARRIHHIVADAVVGHGVRRFELEFDSDSDNNRAVWIHLIVDEDLSPSSEKISTLSRVVNQVRSALLREKLDIWPYVDVRGRA
jgi:hypothetical protein